MDEHTQCLNLFKCEECKDPCFYGAVTLGDGTHTALPKCACNRNAIWQHVRSEEYDEFDEYYMG